MLSARMRSSSYPRLTVGFLSFGLLGLACDKKEEEPVAIAGKSEAQSSPEPKTEPAPTAETKADTPAPADAGPVGVELKSAEGKNVAGTLSLKAASEGVMIEGKITGLSAGSHGFHVHEQGDCSAADFSTAGAHFNPTGQEHGSPTDAKRHAGDMGNLEVSEDGSVTVAMTLHGVTLGEGENSLVGRAIIVHEKADDLKTQPSGDAGGRVACGVIGPAQG